MSAQEDYPELYARVMTAKAEAGFDPRFCVLGDHPVFYVEAPYAFVEGHIYSEAGLSEYRISMICEHCFDKEFAEEDEFDEAPF